MTRDPSITDLDTPHGPAGGADGGQQAVLSSGVGRRFAVFACLLMLAHVLMPWTVYRPPGRPLEASYWWNLVTDYSLSDPLLLQILWMGLAPLALATAAAVRTLRNRGLLLLSLGTIGLVMEGWSVVVGWRGTSLELLNPTHLIVIVALGVIIGGALAGAQFRLVWLRPDLRRQRWMAAAVGVTLLLGLALLGVMVAIAGGRPGSIIRELIPAPMGGDYSLLTACSLLMFLLIALASCLALLLPATGPLPARLARRLLHLPVILTPAAVAISTAHGSLMHAARSSLAPFMEARVLAAFAIYWFCLSFGGELLLAITYGAIDEEERF
ncbi:MAG: hypothetical protein BIFFINMI_02961 [Phycisphaerae bacterium]|nr:hypothetical protein [Phycisphaerae bacterium]